MLHNLLLNPNQSNKTHPNTIDIYADAIKTMFETKKNQTVSKKNDQNTYDLEDENKLIDLENSYKKSLVLLNILQKKIEQNILEKYNLEKNNNNITDNSDNEIIQNTLIKKNS